ncbi:MAG: hypothetical protein EP343_00205 [Deltaproteobacteria bacterium]|nr:MAG: hypothetical protein EP343_00205 [Deltaproteobacteria bacterium]
MNQDKPRQAPNDEFDRTLHAYFQHEREAEDIPLERMLSSIQKSYPPPQTKSSAWKAWWTWTGMSLFAATAAVLFWINPSNSELNHNHQDHATTLPRQRHLITRGSEKPALLVYLERDKKVKQIHSHTLVKQGDHLQLVSQWSEGGYLYVLHSTTTTPQTPVYPSEQNKPSIRVQAGSSVQLPGSLEVTGSSQKPETLWACFSKKPLRYKAVLQQIQHPSKVADPEKPCIVIQTFRLLRTQHTKPQ